jgi:hypothetical protein
MPRCSLVDNLQEVRNGSLQRLALCASGVVTVSHPPDSQYAKEKLFLGYVCNVNKH